VIHNPFFQRANSTLETTEQAYIWITLKERNQFLLIVIQRYACTVAAYFLSQSVDLFRYKPVRVITSRSIVSRWIDSIRYTPSLSMEVVPSMNCLIMLRHCRPQRRMPDWLKWLHRTFPEFSQSVQPRTPVSSPSLA
jgi:hypothetical protein